ncbi:hypothetical protein [Thioalkalivibrio sp. HK1]|uniref:hypothetical protein n=1 Tax=Thioalkalivibrio sp. HK1 TaxID=1469245 RepID=UPI00046FAEDD|nr:hypothetical protein [Thioalkalivibrio sp. HK1]
MAIKERIEGEEASCQSIDDFISLAKKASAEPADIDYAKHLFRQAEALCQMPLDYIRVAETAVAEIGDREFACEIRDQAEEMLFDAQEHLAFARSLAGPIGGDPDKAREHIEIALRDASSTGETLAAIGVARTLEGGTDLANGLLDKIRSEIKDLDGVREIVACLHEAKEVELAREFLEGSAGLCQDLQATIAFAGIVHTLFDDGEWIRRLLDEAEIDCQFTKDFVALATAYRDLAQDSGRASELMEQAGDFCMTFEEQLDLAAGLLEVNDDKAGAAAAYENALGEISDREKLSEIAGTIARSLQNPDLAKRYYAKIEQLTTAASDICRLASEAASALDEPTFAKGILERAIERVSNPSELANIAGELATLDPEQARNAAIKAIDRAGDSPGLARLAESIQEKLSDHLLALEAAAKAVDLAKGSHELLPIVALACDIAQRSEGEGAEKARALARRSLQEAEERVASLGEMQNVAKRVRTDFADDAPWVARIEEKLQRREANQALYTAFLERERNARGLPDLLFLADEVMEGIGDAFYVDKLLGAAEDRWREEGSDPGQALDLIAAVDRHLGDHERTLSLIRRAAENVARLQGLATLGHFASTRLKDRARGIDIACELYAGWEERMSAGRSPDGGGPQERIRLARIVARDLDQPLWVERLLEGASTMSADPMAGAECAIVAAGVGLEESARTLRERAKERCRSVGDATAFVARLLGSGLDEAISRSLYADLRGICTTPLTHREWIRGIEEIFGDREWAARESVEAGLSGSSKPKRAPRW